MSPQHFLAYAIVLAIAVATPGPGMIAVTSCALARGFRAAVAMACGLMVGDLIFFLLATLGLAALARSLGELFLVVKLAGAVYLVWLGIKLWRTRAELRVDATDIKSDDRGFGRNLLTGLVVTLGNPKVIAFYAGLLPTFVDVDKLTGLDLVLMILITMPIVGGIAIAYGFAAARARHFFDHPHRMRAMNRTAGTMMIGAGITVAVR